MNEKEIDQELESSAILFNKKYSLLADDLSCIVMTARIQTILVK